VGFYAEALALYRAGQFADALPILRRAADLDAQDGPTQTLIKRCERFLATPPQMPFDGIAKLEKE
jgi:adenylate cyclase